MGNVEKLAKWFISSHRILPWRTDPSPYRVWVSEIMLQQTQVKTVLPYFERFLIAFPDVKKLANAPIEKVLKNWEGLGYYRRARSLHEGAKLIAVRKTFPANKEEWLEIPGVGPYTAGAIASIAYNEVAPILDGNVERVLSRFFLVGLSKERHKERKNILWAKSLEWVSEADSKKIKPSVTNQALMELGATVCTPKNPLCDLCPVSDDCQALKFDETENYPPKKIRVKATVVNEVRYWIQSGEWYWVEPNLEKNWKQGLWDLPAKLLGAIKNKPIKIIETRHSITRYRFRRQTRVVDVGPKKHTKKLNKTGVWVRLGHEEVPLGGPLKKVIKSF